MAYARSASVRSHRRSGPRRRVRLAPWLVAGLVIVMIGSGISAGYVYMSRKSCTGRATATITATETVTRMLQGLARQWADTGPAVGGTCASVDVTARDSALMAQ